MQFAHNSISWLNQNACEFRVYLGFEHIGISCWGCYWKNSGAISSQIAVDRTHSVRCDMYSDYTLSCSQYKLVSIAKYCIFWKLCSLLVGTMSCRTLTFFTILKSILRWTLVIVKRGGGRNVENVSTFGWELRFGCRSSNTKNGRF